ncbi:MAG: hypothetical protein IKY62_03065 [Clostridia bacterium]|nr:hypothetical protein [Clostridia bacterium]
MKKNLTLILAMLTLLLLVACNNTSSNNTSGLNNGGNYVTSPSATPTEEKLNYKEVFRGGKIETDFVLIKIDEVSTAKTIKSINSSTVMNAKDGEEYVYVKGTIKNTSKATYDLGSMGSYAYSSSVDTLIDFELKMSNGEKEYGSLLIDDGGIYGIMSDGKISPNESVTFYFAFMVDKSKSEYYKNGEIIIAFTDDFKEEPNYKHSNCEYLYKIKLK